MRKLPTSWWSLFYISYFTLLGNVGARKDLTLAMKGHPYYKEEAIIKTFNFDGDVIDCVNINMQPAFDHPLLQNHTIQMKPSFAPKSSRGYSKATNLNGSMVEETHPYPFTKGCPKGSIPITRMPYMNGIVRNNATASDSHIGYSRYLHKHGGIKEPNDYVEKHEYAVVNIAGDNLYGASAVFNVQRPGLEIPEEISLAQIWVASRDKTTVLEAGWIVNPVLYGDDRSRFFTFWTIDRYETGCYNLECAGFVWTNQDIRLDTVLLPSTYQGLQYYVKFEIFQDKDNMDWWLKLEGQAIGYWPRSIVPKLDDGAKYLVYGGEIVNREFTGKHTSTKMGSGLFATEGEGMSASVKQVEIVRADERTRYGVPDHYETHVTNPDCYDLQLGQDPDQPWGFYFYYGGPGRSVICP